MKGVHVLLIPTALAVVGCASPVPVAQNASLSSQDVARSARHWDVVADDVVEQTIDTLESEEALQGRPLFVAASAQPSAFNRAFREFLVTRLVADGRAVAVCRASPAKTKEGFAAEGAQIEVTYDTQLVRHGADLSAYDNEPRKFTWLAAGVLVAHQLSEVHLSTTAGGAVAVAGAAFIDWWRGRSSEATRTEIVVTTTISENNRFVMRRSDIYYVPDEDATLYSHWGRKTNSNCPDETTIASGTAQTEEEIENARMAVVARDMWRVNPVWRGRAYGY